MWCIGGVTFFLSSRKLIGRLIADAVQPSGWRAIWTVWLLVATLYVGRSWSQRPVIARFIAARRRLYARAATLVPPSRPLLNWNVSEIAVQVLCDWV